MTDKLIFPKSFVKRKHPCNPGATQWMAVGPSGKDISIVGGGIGLYGDGVTTFEMWDLNTSGPEGWLSESEINEYLSNLAYPNP